MRRNDVASTEKGENIAREQDMGKKKDDGSSLQCSRRMETQWSLAALEHRHYGLVQGVTD